MWKSQWLLDSRMWRFLLLTPGGRHSQDPSRTSKSMWKVKHNPTPRIPLSVRCFTRHHFMCECVKWNGDFQKCSTLRTSRYLCNYSPKVSRQPWWLFLQKLCGIQGQLSKLVIFGTSWGTPGTFSWTPNWPSEIWNTILNPFEVPGTTYGQYGTFGPKSANFGVQFWRGFL